MSNFLSDLQWIWKCPVTTYRVISLCLSISWHIKYWFGCYKLVQRFRSVLNKFCGVLMFLSGAPLLYHGATKLLGWTPNCTANLSFNRTELSGVSLELQRGFVELHSGISNLKSVLSEFWFCSTAQWTCSAELKNWFTQVSCVHVEFHKSLWSFKVVLWSSKVSPLSSNFVPGRIEFIPWNFKIDFRCLVVSAWRSQVSTHSFNGVPKSS